MSSRETMIIKGKDVRCVLEGKELEIIDKVRQAYIAHARGLSCLPHSNFLRFPNDERNRIIALPAYLGGDVDVAGIKWIASFPGNHEIGLERASAVIILNSTKTGVPEAIMEGSIISARRTAASAALAARELHGRKEVSEVGLVGCGLINFEITRFLLRVWPGIKRLFIYDTQVKSARAFRRKSRELCDAIEVNIAPDIKTVLKNAALVSFATTAIKPHVVDIAESALGSTILHISLRDLSPGVMLSCDNVVDDIEHVCRAQTSIHLTQQLIENTDFIRCTLGEILAGAAPARKDANDRIVFSPFGLGILDLAVSKYVLDLARNRNAGVVIKSFLLNSWPRK